MHDRDRGAPVALAADEPVADAEVDRKIGKPPLLAERDDRGQRLAVRPAVERRRGLHRAVFDISRLHPVRGQRTIGILDDDLDGQSVLAGEVEVALVVGGHRHDHARAVVHHHVVRRPQRHLFAGVGVGHMEAREDALLGGRLGGALRGGDQRLARDEVGHLALAGRTGQELLQQRMLRGDRHERHAVDRVGPRREDRTGVAGLAEREVDARALGAPDPVGLHLAHLIGPLRDGLQVVEQALGVSGDLEKPLFEPALLDGAAAAVAAAIRRDLFVGEGRAKRTPVDRGRLAVGEVPLEELEEDPLRPAVVGRMAGGDLARPVVAHTPRADLPLHVVDVAVGVGLGMHAAVLGGVLGRQAEGVPAHRREDVEAAHELVARQHVAHDVVAAVADMHRARRVGEHSQAVELLARRVARVAAEGLVLLPPVLPLALDLRERVLLLHKASLPSTRSRRGTVEKIAHSGPE